jgi:hypothetical protein
MKLATSLYDIDVLFLVHGRISKQDMNGRKTAIMNITGFLCVSLGSSTVQFHDSLRSTRTFPCSDAGFSSQNGDRA